MSTRPIIFALVAAIWMTLVFYFNWSWHASAIAAANAANATSCSASLATLSAIQLTAYNCRAADMQPILPTLQSVHNIELEVYETDGRATLLFSIIQVRWLSLCLWTVALAACAPAPSCAGGCHA